MAVIIGPKKEQMQNVSKFQTNEVLSQEMLPVHSQKFKTTHENNWIQICKDKKNTQ